jgi:hypothetical protein
MRENIKMLWIIFYDIIANIYWQAAWNNWFMLSNINHRNKSLDMCLKAQVMKGNWCGNHVYRGSVWHGLIVDIDETQMVIQVMTQQQSRDLCKLKEQTKC